MPELTKIDKFEKLAQGFYLYSMFVAPAWFMDDQFVDKSLATNPGVLCLCSIIGCLCACITALTYVARTADCATDAFLKTVDQVSAATWALVAVNDVRLKDQYPESAFQQNMVLYAALIGGLYYQSTTRGEAKKAK